MIFGEKIVRKPEMDLKQKPFLVITLLSCTKNWFSYLFFWTLNSGIVAPLTFLAPSPPFCKAITGDN